MHKINDVASSYGDDIDISKMLDDLSNEGLVSENAASAMELYFDIYNRSANVHNIEDISNFYMSTIASESSLTLEEKEALISSIITGTASPFYWASVTE